MNSGIRLGKLRFRTSERYELVLQDRLRPEERRRFEPLASDPNHWGILRPRGPGNYRAVDRNTALLLYSLQEPGPLPAYVLEGVSAADRDRLQEQIRAMLLDGILEAETAQGEAYDPLAGRDEEGDLGLDARSLAALRYAVALGLDDPRDLALRLYLYGGEPLSRAICDRFVSRQRVLEFLGLSPGAALRRKLPTGWMLDANPRSDWFYLRQPELRNENRVRGRCKLYVGTGVEELPEVLEEVIEALADGRARSMKVGACAADLVRTDKLVVYFSAFEELQRFAAVLSERLKGLGDSVDPAGWAVPFTAPAGGGGRLTWGADPPAGAIPLTGTFTESWRAWVTSRLASALVGARESLGKVESAGHESLLRAVVERVRLEGVDVSRWTPTARLWGDVL